jgi:hypothetical protein
MPNQAEDGCRETRACGSALRATNFSFLPKDLLEKCRPFIIRFHEINGYSSLPDILWNPETGNLINSSAYLSQLFKAATSSRSAKRANDGLIGVATLILALEILATGAAGWGDRCPEARKRARAVWIEFAPSARPWLIQCYLYPDANPRRDAPTAVERADVPDRDAPTQSEVRPRG